jgi:hypothetical protein
MTTLTDLKKRIDDEIVDEANTASTNSRLRIVSEVFAELNGLIERAAMAAWETAEAEAEKRYVAAVDAITTKVDDERRYATGMQQPLRAETLREVTTWITDAIKENTPE